MNEGGVAPLELGVQGGTVHLGHPEIAEDQVVRSLHQLPESEEIARSRRFHAALSVVVLDLDGFKAINDQFGHAAGDAVLRTFAQCLARCTRETDLVARLGGDEFAVLLTETDEPGARQYAERVQLVVASAGGAAEERRITARFGVAAVVTDDPVTPDELLAAADEALYLAKRAGKNQVATAGTGSLVPVTT